MLWCVQSKKYTCRLCTRDEVSVCIFLECLHISAKHDPYRPNNIYPKNIDKMESIDVYIARYYRLSIENKISWIFQFFINPKCQLNINFLKKPNHIMKLQIIWRKMMYSMLENLNFWGVFSPPRRTLQIVKFIIYTNGNI